ncbi:hypothetical protein [Sphingomonas sp.]|jgi:hypothetical protein|uniref:hypothetical protein n=1 Tax=Sphingomonas sp. TaxID=28214 RepID=UPI00260AD937|nr:hypothetical protein [Sphingomonas sp.]MDF2494179.1 hypothetical protein [Sphingomonas sp.]
MPGHIIPSVVGLAATFLACSSAVPAPTSRDLLVRTTPQLIAAIRRARGGERIQLAPGIFPPFNIRGINPARPVTLVSRNPSDPAILTGITLRDSSNLTLSQLTLQSAGSAVQHGFVFHRVHDVSSATSLTDWPEQGY